MQELRQEVVFPWRHNTSIVSTVELSLLLEVSGSIVMVENRVAQLRTAPYTCDKDTLVFACRRVLQEHLR